jgi:hypothetical protein
MFEKILQDGETVELQENCDYCGDGALAMVNTGWAVLTNKRFIICKDQGAIKDGIKAGIKTGLIAGLFGGVAGALKKAELDENASKRTVSVEAEELSFAVKDIANVESGNRGVRKMLVIKTKNGDICKISVKDMEKWRSALLK